MLNEPTQYRASCHRAGCGNETPHTGPRLPLGLCSCQDASIHHSVYPQPPVPGPVSMPPMCSKARAQLLSSQSFPLAEKTNRKQVRLTLRCENCCQGCASLNGAPGLAQVGRGGEGSLELDSERGSSGRGQATGTKKRPHG